MIPLNGQVAVVTGGGSGIGKAIALALAAQGATLALVGRRRALLESVAGETPKARVYPADLADEGQIHDLSAALRRDLGRVDILVHSAAVHLRVQSRKPRRRISTCTIGRMCAAHIC